MDKVISLVVQKANYQVRNSISTAFASRNAIYKEHQIGRPNRNCVVVSPISSVVVLNALGLSNQAKNMYSWFPERQTAPVMVYVVLYISVIVCHFRLDIKSLKRPGELSIPLCRKLFQHLCFSVNISDYKVSWHCFQTFFLLTLESCSACWRAASFVSCQHLGNFFDSFFSYWANAQ